MMKLRVCLLLIAAGLYFPMGYLWAASEDRAINFGASAAVQESKIRKQAEQNLTRARGKKPLTFGEEPAAETPDTGPAFYVAKVTLEGDVLLEAPEYTPLLEKFEGREVRFSEIQKLIHALEQLFRDRGFIAVVLLPPQKLEKEEVHLKVVTSRMGVSRLFHTQLPVNFMVATRIHRLVVPSTQLVNVRQSVPGVLVATGRSRVEISSGSATAALNRAFEYRA